MYTEMSTVEHKESVLDAEFEDAKNRVLAASAALDTIVEKRLGMLTIKMIRLADEYNGLSITDKWVIRTSAELRRERDRRDIAVSEF